MRFLRAIRGEGSKFGQKPGLRADWIVHLNVFLLNFVNKTSFIYICLIQLQFPSYIILQGSLRAHSQISTLQKRHFHSLDKLKDVEWNWHSIWKERFRLYCMLAYFDQEPLISYKSCSSNHTCILWMFIHGTMVSGNTESLNYVAKDRTCDCNCLKMLLRNQRGLITRTNWFTEKNDFMTLLWFFCSLFEV